jgi:hypothetical protein
LRSSTSPQRQEQDRTPEAGTRPDFFYGDGYEAAIYIDGPHQDDPERRARDAAKVEAMEDLGYMVIRVGHTQDWEEIARNYPYAFGGES